MAKASQQLSHPVNTTGDADEPEAAPQKVTFPLALQKQGTVESLKLEVEESDETMSPRNMWQVRFFLLGYFSIPRRLVGPDFLSGLSLCPPPPQASRIQSCGFLLAFSISSLKDSSRTVLPNETSTLVSFVGSNDLF